MKTAKFKLKKSIRANVTATEGEVKIKFPKQSLGYIAINLVNANGNFLIKQFGLTLMGDSLKVEVVK